MKNFKKMVLGLMLLLAVFTFVGCPTDVPDPAPTPTPEQPAEKPSDTPAGGNGGTEQKPSAGGNGGEEQKPSTGGNGEEENKPVVVENKFKENIFEVSCKMPFGCIYYALEFESETVVNQYAIDIDEDSNEYIKKETLTYTVKDDVATITFTNEDGSKDTVTTSKIENDSFSFEVTEEGMTFNFSCKKSDKSILEEWTMYFLGVEDDTEYFLNILGRIADYKLVENTDYTLDKENKIINITESGLAKLEGDQPADGEYIVMYKGEIFESFSTFEEFEAFLSILDKYDSETESGDYFSDDAFTVVLTDEGYAKLTGNGDDEEEDPPAEAFKGNVYVMSTDSQISEEEYFTYILGYVDFTDEANGKIVLLASNEETNEEYLDELAFSYSVNDDVATITLEDIESTTSQLENDVFTFEFDGLSTTCKKGDTSLFVKGNLLLDGTPLIKEMYLASIINQMMLMEEDYIVEDGNLVLTEAFKVKNDLYTVCYPDGTTSVEPFEDLMYDFGRYGLEEDVHYTIDEENRIITLNEEGLKIYNEEDWGIIDLNGAGYWSPKFEKLSELGKAGCVVGEDYTIDEENRQFILTESGSEKWNDYYNSQSE